MLVVSLQRVKTVRALVTGQFDQTDPLARAAQAIVNAATKQRQRVNPKLLLVQLQKERSLMSSSTLPPAFDLNRAFGCKFELYPTFLKQLNDCAAKTLRKHFDEAPSMPHFFPATTPGDSINHFVYDPQVGSLGDQVVGFTMNTKATYWLYKYTNHIVARIENGILGGGNYSFEVLWKQYSELGIGW